MKEKTLHELAKEFPNKTYVELEKYREADRQQEAGSCIMGEARKDRESEKDRTSSDKNKYYWMWREEKKKRQEAEGETTIVKGIGQNSPEMKSAKSEVEALKQQLHTDREKYKKESNDLYNRIADALAINEDHQKLNGKLQMRITELEQENLELHADNKKLAHQIEDRINKMRKAGM